MKVCVYLESIDLLTPSGFPSAFRQQLLALKLAGVEVTTNPRDRYDLLHVNWTAPKSIYHLRRAKRRGIKVVAHAHSVGAFDMWNSFTLSNAVAPLYDRYVRWFYAQADCVVTPSPRAREILLAKGLDLGHHVLFDVGGRVLGAHHVLDAEQGVDRAPKIGS